MKEEPELHRWSARDLSGAVRSGRLRAVEILAACLARIERCDPKVHAFLAVAEKRARTAAERIDASVRSGQDPGALAGVPVAVKDNISTESIPTSCGSRILERFVPVYDATAVRRLVDSGAVLIGKTNLDEFGMGSSTENSAFGPTRNPWDLEHVPGGSSGGSAAAVAMGMAPLALGTDTGGSIRQPGSFCGLVALKPHYGTVSRWGLIAFASSHDVIGGLARDATDCAWMHRVLQARDEKDATSVSPPNRIDPDEIDRPVAGMRLALPVAWLGEGVDASVRRRLERAIALFRDLGVVIEEVDLPDPRYAIAAYYTIANAEASSNLARFDGVRYGRRAAGVKAIDDLYERSRAEGFGPEVKRRILLGTFVLSSGYFEEYYLRAQRVRQFLCSRYEEVVSAYDAVLIPTSPTVPFRLGERTCDPLAMYLSDLYTILANLLGVPAISFPGGRTDEGLPIGLQLIGRDHGEQTLLQLVRAHEMAGDYEGSARDPASPINEPHDAGESR